MRRENKKTKFTKGYKTQEVGESHDRLFTEETQHIEKDLLKVILFIQIKLILKKI